MIIIIKRDRWIFCLMVVCSRRNTLVIRCNTQLQSGSTRSKFGRYAKSPIQCESHVQIVYERKNPVSSYSGIFQERVSTSNRTFDFIQNLISRINIELEFVLCIIPHSTHDFIDESHMIGCIMIPKRRKEGKIGEITKKLESQLQLCER